MKRLEKAIAECGKARERMEASKAKYEEDVRKLRTVEAAVTEAVISPLLPEKEEHGDYEEAAGESY